MRVRHLAALLGVAMMALAVAACGPAPSASPSTSAAPTPVPPTAVPGGTSTLPAGVGVRVTLGIYSGRPDPSWTLTADEAAKVAAAIAALQASGEPLIQGGLGYRGFTIDEGGRRATAFLGGVVSDVGGAQKLLDDPGRTVERLLLELARQHLAAAEITEVERSLGAGG